MTTLLESFLLAALVPVAVIAVLRVCSHIVRPNHNAPFDLASLEASIRRLDGSL